MGSQPDLFVSCKEAIEGECIALIDDEREKLVELEDEIHELTDKMALVDAEHKRLSRKTTLKGMRAALGSDLENWLALHEQMIASLKGLPNRWSFDDHGREVRIAILAYCRSVRRVRRR